MSIHPDLVGLVFPTNEQDVQKMDVASTSPPATTAGPPGFEDVPTVKTPSEKWGGLPFDPTSPNLTEAQRKLRDKLAFENFSAEKGLKVTSKSSEEIEGEEMEREEKERAQRTGHWWKSHLAMNSW